MSRTRPVLSALVFLLLLALGATAAAAQTGSIHGTVSDSATLEPLAGALVTEVGSGRRAEANERGEYRLTEVPAGTARVRVQMIGFAPAEQQVEVSDGGDADASFALAAGVARLQEVVSVGYGTRLRSELSTAVSSVDGADLVNQPIASVDGALQGKAAGVQVVQNAGNPGNAISVRVRGLASVSASNDPLYVVDGIPMIAGDLSQLGLGGQGVAAISSISTDDIQTVDVLKDAAATAIYGSRGSNGVVVITTKRGAPGRTTVDFNSYVGTQRAARRLPLLNAQQYLEFFNESAVNDDQGEELYGVPGVDDLVSTDWQDGVLRSADLGEAKTLITSTGPTTRATAGAVDALLARVQLYRGDYPAAAAAADAVIGAGYTLADTYPELFDAEGADTPEDIFKATFTAVNFNFLGFYYITEDDGGLGAVLPSQSIIDAYGPADERLAWNITGDTEGSASGTKYPTTAGAEDFHVIRFAEVLLIKAEALARQSDLAGAVDAYNPLRVRAGLAPHVLGVDVTTQDEVLAAITQERRLELAFEGDRWPDLVRTGQAVAVLGIPEFQTLFPIPQTQRDVAPGVTQNPGY